MVNGPKSGSGGRVASARPPSPRNRPNTTKRPTSTVLIVSFTLELPHRLEAVESSHLPVVARVVHVPVDVRLAPKRMWVHIDLAAELTSDNCFIHDVSPGGHGLVFPWVDVVVNGTGT